MGEETSQETTSRFRPGRALVHFLGFGLLLALILTLVWGPPRTGDEKGLVAFTEADLKQIHARHSRTWNRPPTADELRKAMGQYVREEILYREALARGFDRDDPTVRLAMVRKVMMLGTARASAKEPTDKELQAYFALRREQYRVPAVVYLVQVFVSPEKRGVDADADAERILEELRERDPKGEELDAYGDSLMLAGIHTDMSEYELDRTFGKGFSAAVVESEVGQWVGPVTSGYGLHLIKVIKRQDRAIPDWTEVRDEILSDMRYEAREAADDQLFAEIAPRYQVTYDDAVARVLEGSAQ